MSERESKATIGEAAKILGVKPTTVKGARRIFIRGGRALTSIGYLKPYLVKFKRMAPIPNHIQKPYYSPSKDI
ncbi:MAG: hypothetical protein QMD13_03015 [Candidatus Bathyarchaeia archaeon]|nr:hypothetical protein [Candidatus Bathyarchaeia archaeon]